MAYLLGFGKYKDKTLEWLFFHDPGYVWWMIAEDATKNLRGPARDVSINSRDERSIWRFLENASTAIGPYPA